ncbi:hypothetical protein BDW71DRAFT_173568 [Aspergillus fruticulosus]
MDWEATPYCVRAESFPRPLMWIFYPSLPDQGLFWVPVAGLSCYGSGRENPRQDVRRDTRRQPQAISRRSSSGRYLESTLKCCSVCTLYLCFLYLATIGPEIVSKRSPATQSILTLIVYKSRQNLGS